MLPVIDEATIEKVKADHAGRVLHLLESEDGHAIFRTPDEGTFQRYWDEVLDEERRSGAHRNLVLGCVVHPPREEFVKVLAALPGLVQSFGPRLVKIAGAKKEATSRKL